ncbi:MAG: response regulator [Anaerolineae bacterium]|jgi:DNA-binding NarL/FixJ family response regulator
MRRAVLALIVAPPGRLRDAWRALLVATPGIREVRVADDGDVGLDLLRVHRPGLVLLEGGLRDGRSAALVRRIKSERPDCRCIVVSSDVDVQEPVQEPGQATGFDAVLLKGFPAARFFETVKGVLSH